MNRLGYYSKKSAERYGYWLYRTESGKIVEVTTVLDSGQKPVSAWEDEVFVGYVSEFVKSCRVRGYQPPEIDFV